MTNKPFPPSVQIPHQYEPSQSSQINLIPLPTTGSGPNCALGPNETMLGEAVIGPAHTMNNTTFGPAIQSYAGPYDSPPFAASIGGPFKCQGNPSYRYPSRIVQHAPITAGPPPQEYHALPSSAAGDENGIIGSAPLTNVAGPSQGTPNPMPSRLSAMEDLKCLASRYLHNPNSRVDKIHMKRQPGHSEIVIVLEIPDTV